MRIEDEAAALIAAADPAAVAAVVADFPEAEKIGLRDNWLTLNPHLGQRVPKAPAARVKYLAQRIEHMQGALQEDITRYNELRAKAIAALSAYDVCISSGCDPVGALRTALRLKDAHISYDLSLLVKLALDLEDAQAELAATSPAAQPGKGAA